MFEDRMNAGRRLARALSRYTERDELIAEGRARLKPKFFGGRPEVPALFLPVPGR
jgi:hypothetical protein